MGLLEAANRGRFQDGVVGMTVGKGSALNNIVVRDGIAKVGGKNLEQPFSSIAVDIAVPATLGAHTVYLNAPGALASYPSGSALAMITVDTFEGNKLRTAINGSVSETFGRSLVLANLTTTAPKSTVTLAGTWADGDTAVTVINSESISYVLGTGEGATVTLAAAAVAANINADATASLIVHATSALGVITITALSAVAYTLTVSKTSTNGTTTASAGTLVGGGIVAATGIDNKVKLEAVGASYSTRVNAG